MNNNINNNAASLVNTLNNYSTIIATVFDDNFDDINYMIENANHLGSFFNSESNMLSKLGIWNNNINFTFEPFSEMSVQEINNQVVWVTCPDLQAVMSI